MNNKDYCCKLLIIEPDGISSLHYHNKKRETFFCILGDCVVNVEDSSYHLTAFNGLLTIKPKQKHRFFANERSVLLEMSTQHKEEDTIRLEESKCIKTNDA